MRNTALVPCCVYSVPPYSLTRFLTFFRNSNAGTFPMKSPVANCFVGHVCCDVKRAAMKGGGPPIIHPRCFLLLLLLFGGGGGGNPFSNLQTFGAKKIGRCSPSRHAPSAAAAASRAGRWDEPKRHLAPPSPPPLPFHVVRRVVYCMFVFGRSGSTYFLPPSTKWPCPATLDAAAAVFLPIPPPPHVRTCGLLAYSGRGQTFAQWMIEYPTIVRPSPSPSFAKFPPLSSFSRIHFPLFHHERLFSLTFSSFHLPGKK